MFEELKEKYSDDIELISILDEYESFVTSPIRESVITAKHVIGVIQKSLNHVDLIDLDSESRDVERIKMLMDLLIIKSIEIDDIVTKRNIDTGEVKRKSYSDKAADEKRKMINMNNVNER
jgi:hypothetical protein